MNDSQYPVNDHALPLGYDIHGYTISKYLGEDDFSFSYLALSGDVEVVLMEYFPRSMVVRGEDHAEVVVKDGASQGEYAKRLAICHDDLQDLAGFHHPHIADTLSFFEANNSIYRVGESVINDEWMCLEDCLRDDVLTEDDIISLLQSLLDAMQAMHAMGHIHSDLTPSKLLIHRSSGRLKISGVGEMKYLFRTTKQLVGSYVSSGYSPPENYYTSAHQGVWTDIYAFGAILYRIVTETAPVSSAARISSLADHQHDPLIPATHFFGDKEAYSQSFLSAIDHALALQKEDRPQSIEAWRKELDMSVARAVEEKASMPDLAIEGISYLPAESQVRPKTETLDFAALVKDIPPEEQATSSRAYAPIAIVVGLMSALLVGAFLYLSPNEPEELVLDESSVPHFPVVEVEEAFDTEVHEYLESDYQEILDVPLSDRVEEVVHADIPLPFADYSPDEFSVLTVKQLVNTVNIDWSKIVVVSAEPLSKSEVAKVRSRSPSSSTNVITRKRKVKHHPRKTRGQYQREWLAKQQQIQKRAEWEKRKAQLKKAKNLRIARELEGELLAENDW